MTQAHLRVKETMYRRVRHVVVLLCGVSLLATRYTVAVVSITVTESPGRAPEIGAGMHSVQKPTMVTIHKGNIMPKTMVSMPRCSSNSSWITGKGSEQQWYQTWCRV